MDIDRPGFQNAIEKGGSIKSRFMNQKKIAGIGNVYADEILDQTGILPERKAIDRKETDRLFSSMQRILKVSILISCLEGISCLSVCVSGHFSDGKNQSGTGLVTGDRDGPMSS